MSVRLSSDDVNSLEEDELSLVLYIVEKYMGLDPLFIKSIKKKKIHEALISVESLLSETGRDVHLKVLKKLYL